MGLDITAYKGLTPAPEVSVEEVSNCDREDWADFAIFHKLDPWLAYAPEILENTAYRYTDSMDFRAGSYGGFSAFRDILCKIGGFDAVGVESIGMANFRYKGPVDHLPFFHLVCFSDCEGTIGTEACKRLAKEFADNREKFAKEVEGSDSEYYLGRYDDWQKACEMASDGGALRFH